MSTPDERLDAAVARGIITAAQRDAIQALAADASAPRARPEAERELDTVTIAYYLGGLAILFAFGWLLADRWRVLGAGGVLAVSAVYAVVFLGVAGWLRREGYERARGIAVLAAVALTPVATWAVMELAGLWTPRLGGEPPFPQGGRGDWEVLRWIPLELATALAALVALRKVRFPLLVLPVPVAAWLVIAHLTQVSNEPWVGGPMQGFAAFLAAAVLLCAGYAVDCRAARLDGEDFGWPVHLVVIVALMVGWMFLWGELRAGRHALVVVSALSVALALALRRRIYFVAGQVGFALYVGYLGFSVFRKALGFPIALATVGLVIILGTVWMQRRFPGLTRRAERRPGDAPRLPGGWLAPAGLVAITAALYAGGPAHARERQRDREIRNHVMLMRGANLRRLAERATRDSVQRGLLPASALTRRGPYRPPRRP